VVYFEHAPTPELRADVACYWTAVTSDANRILPDGCVDILFDMHKGRAEVAGVMTRAVVTPEGTRSSFLGVRFKPGAAFRMLGVSARETRDGTPLLDELWGRVGRELAQRIFEGRTLTERLAILNQTLTRHGVRTRDPRVMRAVSQISQTHGATRMATLAAELGLGVRQLERLFDEHVGIGPKMLARVVRMQHAVKGLGRAPMASLSRASGYADQAHMIRDFEALAGVSPGELCRERAMSHLFNPGAVPADNLTAWHTHQEKAP